MSRPQVLWLLMMGVLLATIAGPMSAALAQDVRIEAQIFSNATGERENFPGAVIAVTDADGNEVGTGTAGDDGVAVVPVPEVATYNVTLDESTIPEGFGTGDLGPQREVTIREGTDVGRTLFNLESADGSSGGTSTLSKLPSLIVSGLRFGFIIAITAIGLSLVFGTTGLVNFAHGELVTMGAIIAWLFNAASVGWLPQLPLWLAAIPAILIGAATGVGLERGVWRPMRRRGIGLISMLVVSIGLSLLLRNVLQLFFGAGAEPYRQGVQTVVLFALTPIDVISILVSLVMLVGVGLMLTYTRIGKAMRAVADNRDLAESSGINVDNIVAVVWALGGGLAALGGVLQAATTSVDVNFGFQLLLLMFAGVILGGIGTAFGAIVGSLIVGVVIEVSTLFLANDIKNAAGLAVLILVLLFRPQGILGRAERLG